MKKLLAALLFLASCSQAPPETVLLKGRYDSVPIRIEIADEPDEHSLGLMNRPSLAPNSGMLFIFPDEREHSFWMRNTHISLDIIFIDSSKRIVGIVKRAQPESDESLTVGRPSQFVLEVEAGLSDKIGLSVGDPVGF